MWTSTKPGTTVFPSAVISRAPRGKSTFPLRPTAAILLSCTTTRASEISSNGVNARSAWMTIGCIWTGSSYLKAGVIGKYAVPGSSGTSRLVGSQAAQATFIPVQGSCLWMGRGATLCGIIAPILRGESGLIGPWLKHLQADVDAPLHLPPQVAVRSGGC